MIQIVFTIEEMNELQDIFNKHPHCFVRTKALVLILKSQKIPHGQIAKITNLSENTIRSYFREYIAQRIKSITILKFRKPEKYLKPFEDEIKIHLRGKPPASIKQICAEIGELTGIFLGETQMRYYLKSLGLKYRKVAPIPAKANIEEQQEFLELMLKPRLKEAEEGLRQVYFVDAAHFVLGSFLGYLWSFTRIFIKTPSGRQRFNVLGALDAISNELLTITNTTYITSIQVCELLELIAKKAIKPVTIVLDNAKYQRCKLVMEKAQELNIELLFLPPYSPNLNLIERLWKFTKKHCLNSIYYADFNLFKMAISSFFNNMHLKHAADLKTLLALNFQVFTKDQFESIN